MTAVSLFLEYSKALFSEPSESFSARNKDFLNAK
ncbi:hypothetical protein CP061683_0618, partial [Chlamydia psittaci 06-1683]